MRPWQQWWTTVTGWYRSSNSVTRMACIAIPFALVAVMIGSRNGWLEEGRVDLFKGRHLTSDEIGAMQIAFGQAGLNDYEVEPTSVRVHRAERASFLKALADHGAIPADLNTPENQTGLEFLQSRSWQRHHLLERKKQTIREMVQQLAFVRKAIVDYDETRGISPFEDLRRAAIVTVQPEGTRVLEPVEVKAVRDTVRGAVAGLRSSDVTVIDINANRSYVGDDELIPAHAAPHAAARIEEERKYENKIRSALSAYPGVRVNVEVAIDPILRRVRDERTVDPDAVTVNRTVEQEYSRPGPATSPSTQPLESRFAGANGQARIFATSGTQRKTEVIQSVSGGSFESIETAGLTVTRVQVSIGVPERCVDWFVNRQQRQTTATSARAGNRADPPSGKYLARVAEEAFAQIRDDVRQKVLPLVPSHEAFENDGPNIVVTVDPEIPIDHHETLEYAAPLTASFPWPTVIVVGLGVLLVVWASPRSPSIRHRGSARSLRRALPARADNELLVQLDEWSRENPDAADDTIRAWMQRRAG